MKCVARDVLENWAREAAELEESQDRATWVADRFFEWVEREGSLHLQACEQHLARIEEELDRRGGWSNESNVSLMDAVTHAKEELLDLAAQYGMTSSRAQLG